MEQASDSLAGRVHFVDMSGFSLAEVGDHSVAGNPLFVSIPSTN